MTSICTEQGRELGDAVVVRPIPTADEQARSSSQSMSPFGRRRCSSDPSTLTPPPADRHRARRAPLARPAAASRRDRSSGRGRSVDRVGVAGDRRRSDQDLRAGSFEPAERGMLVGGPSGSGAACQPRAFHAPASAARGTNEDRPAEPTAFWIGIDRRCYVVNGLCRCRRRRGRPPSPSACSAPPSSSRAMAPSSSPPPPPSWPSPSPPPRRHRGHRRRAIVVIAAAIVAIAAVLTVPSRRDHRRRRPSPSSPAPPPPSTAVAAAAAATTAAMVVSAPVVSAAVVIAVIVVVGGGAAAAVRFLVACSRCRDRRRFTR